MYYIYKTTNIVNKKIYIGLHKSDDINNDNYIGSGTALLKSVKKYGKENFIREILFEFNTFEEAINKESIIVNNTFVKRRDTYNLINGGFCADNIRGHNQDKICLTNIETSKLKYVNIDDVNYFLNEGYLIGNIKSGINKNTVYINKNKKNKRIKECDLEKFLSDGWIKGFYQLRVKSKRMYNPLTNELKEIPIDELLEYENIGWLYGNNYASNKNKIYITKNKSNKRVNIEDLELYLQDGWIKGMYNKKYDKSIKK